MEAVRWDGPHFFNPAASWFETRGVVALLTMRVEDFIRTTKA
jgi:hypothetical protein